MGLLKILAKPSLVGKSGFRSSNRETAGSGAHQATALTTISSEKFFAPSNKCSGGRSRLQNEWRSIVPGGLDSARPVI